MHLTSRVRSASSIQRQKLRRYMRTAWRVQRKIIVHNETYLDPLTGKLADLDRIWKGNPTLTAFLRLIAEFAELANEVRS